MQFELQGQTLNAVLINPRQTKPSYLGISTLCILQPGDLHRLLSCSKKWLSGKKYHSQRHLIQVVLQQFGRYLYWDIQQQSKDECVLPVDYMGWQRLTLQFGLWYISQTESKASLATRCKQWSPVCNWLSFLQAEGVIPLGVIWHDMRLPKEHVMHESPQNPRLMGDAPASPVTVDKAIEKAPINKTLAGPIFWQTDTEYLDKFEATLRHRDKVLAEALNDYWTRLVRDYRTGKQLLNKVTEADWKRREKDNEWRFAHTGTPIYVTSPANPEGHLWALRLIQQQLLHGDNHECLRTPQLRQSPAVAYEFLKQAATTPVSTLLDLSALLSSQKKYFKPRHIFNRYLGILNNCDMAIAIALLIREHPNLTPMSLAGARLLNSRGKSYLLVTDDAQSQIFSINKPRASKRKYTVLSHRAAQVMRHLVRSTALIRDLLRRSGNAHWRYLFLGDIDQGRLGHPTNMQAQLLSSATYRGVTLAKLYPSLAVAGLGKSTLTFSKLRNTQGVLAWFNKGSIQEVSRRLGNSKRVAIKHYIPESLLAAWNERIIRRFQNTLLILAAHEEIWLLDAVDMSSLGELHHFLAQLVYELPYGRSPIADKVQEYFGARYRIDQKSTISSASQANGLLQVRLSPNSLALLLAYRQWSQSHLTQSIQTQPDNKTGLTPKHFIDLAGMLQATAQNEQIGDQLRESLDVAKLQRCYMQAIKIVPSCIARMKRFSIQTATEEGCTDGYRPD